MKRRPFVRPLKEVLKRLSDDVFECVETQIEFVVDVDDYLAVSVPFRDVVPPSSNSSHTINRDVIILFRSCWQLSHAALVGLIAHEIAHSITVLQDHHENEAAADAFAREWGFAKELNALDIEKAERFDGLDQAR